MTPRITTRPNYKVVLKKADDSTVVEVKFFHIGKLADRYARMWPKYNAYVFKQNKLILSVPATIADV